MRAWLLGLASLLWCAPGFALTPALSWEAPTGCPDQNHVRTALASRLDLGALQGVRSVAATVEAVADGFHMTLVLVTSDGRHARQFTAALCSTFVELLSLELGFAGAEPMPSRSAAVARLRYGARLSGSVLTGPLPRPAGGLSLALSLSLRALHFEIAGLYGWPRTIHYATEPSVGARFDLLGGEARFCYVVRLTRVGFPLCVGAEAGSLRGRGVGLEQTATARRPWAALFVAPALQVHIAGPFSIWLEAAVGVRLWSSSFGILNLPTLHRPSRFVMRGGLGLALTFE